MKQMPRAIIALLAGRTQISGRALMRLHTILAVVFLLQGFAILLFGTPYNASLNALFLTNDSFQAQITHRMTLAMAVHQLGAFNIAYLAAALFFIPALLYILIRILYAKQYEAGLKNGFNCFRWIDYSLSSAAILTALGLLVGIQDVLALVFISIYGLMIGAGGMFLELRMTLEGGSARFRALPKIVLAVLAGVLLCVIVFQISVTGIFSENHAPRYFYWITTAVIVAYGAYYLNARMIYRKKGKWAQYSYGEFWYLMGSLMIRTLVAWLIFAAVLHA